MIKADNTQKKCFVACDEQTRKDGRCSCLTNTHQALQLQQTDVSNNEVAVAFVKWLTENDSKYAILYGGTPELEKDYRLATLENDFTIEEVFEHFKKATDY
jgi:hypothetical protein